MRNGRQWPCSNEADCIACTASSRALGVRCLTSTGCASKRKCRLRHSQAKRQQCRAMIQRKKPESVDGQRQGRNTRTGEELANTDEASMTMLRLKNIITAGRNHRRIRVLDRRVAALLLHCLPERGHFYFTDIGQLTLLLTLMGHFCFTGRLHGRSRYQQWPVIT